METILTTTLTRLPHLLLHCPRPLPRPTRSPLLAKLSLPLRPIRRATLHSCSCSTSSPRPSFNGWEEGGLPEPPSGSDPVRYLLVSLGIANRKDAFLFCLGFVCAFAVSRVRFSVIALVPVSVLAFAAGLSARALDDCPKRPKDGSMVMGFLEFLDAKIADSKDVVRYGDADRCMEVAEAVKSAPVPAKEAVSDRKAGGRSRESGFGGVDLVELVGSFIRKNLGPPRPSKSRDGTVAETVSEKLDALGKDGRDGRDRGDNVGGESKGNVSGSVASREMDGINDGTSFKVEMGGTSQKGNTVSLRGLSGVGEAVGETANVEERSENPISRTNALMNAENAPRHSGRLPLEEEGANLDETLRFVDMKRSFERMVLEQKSYRKENVEGSSKVGVSSRATGSEMWSSESGSALREETLVEIRNKSCSRSVGMGNENSVDQKRNRASGFGKENNRASQDVFGNDPFETNLKSCDTPSPLPASSDEEFNHNIKEAEILLKQAKECLKSEDDEEAAEIRLSKSAELLSTAIALKPRSLLAVGQLGNTFLLHGELKLKISRDLRTLLSRSSPVTTRKGSRLRHKSLNKPSLSKEKLALALIDVCEECEELLVKAGKSYGMALSIDESDIRALYNWGLALTFRAQLIGDIGPEAAFDADKVYLAAIDKFSALTSRSRTFAPYALFRWALALQRRSQLRPPDSQEKIKLLKQAKSLFEDVLRSDTDNPVAREALFSCISELNFYRQLK